MAAALASAAGTLSCAEPRPKSVPAPSTRGGPIGPGDVVGRVVASHNAERSRRKLAPLVASPELEAAAAGHAVDMANRRRMAHKGGDGSSPFDRIKRQGYAFRSAGENVAFGFDDVDAVMSGWMHSPGHRLNILGDYSEIGVGRATARDGASYWCVTFGTPAGR